MDDVKPGLKRFSAQISYTSTSGYGCNVGFKGDGKQAPPLDAMMCLLHELGLVAERAGWGDLAIDALSTRVHDVRAAISKAEESAALAARVA